MKTIINKTESPVRQYLCDQCNEGILWSDLVLIREKCALPEEQTYHVHKACIDPFLKNREGCWSEIARDSKDAGWLLF